MVMAKRKFKDINNMIDENYSLLNEIKRLQLITNIHYIW